MRILVELEQSEDSLNAGPTPLPTLTCIFCKCVLSFIDGDPTKFFFHLRDNHSIHFNHSLALYISLMEQNKIDEFVKDSFKFVKNTNDKNLVTTKNHNIDGYDDTVSFLINEEVVSESEKLSDGNAKENEDKIDDTVSFLINEKVVCESASEGTAKENEDTVDDTFTKNDESYFTNKKYNDISILSTLSTMSIEDSAKSMAKKLEKQQKIKRRLSFKTCLNDEEFYGPGNRNFFSLQNRLELKGSRSKNKSSKVYQKIGINNNIIKHSDESKLQKNADRFTCNLCGKRFAAKGSLNIHMKTHTEGLPIRTRAGKLEEQMNALQRRISMLNKK